MNGITYYRISSPWPNDYTKNCSLNGIEIDNNFLTLEGRDIQSIEVDGDYLVVTRFNGYEWRISLPGGGGGGSCDANVYAQTPDQNRITQLVNVNNRSSVYYPITLGTAVKHNNITLIDSSTNQIDTRLLPSDYGDIYTKAIKFNVSGTNTYNVDQNHTITLPSLTLNDNQKYGTSSSIEWFAPLTSGTIGNLLKSNGSNGAPSWVTNPTVTRILLGDNEGARWDNEPLPSSVDTPKALLLTSGGTVWDSLDNIQVETATELSSDVILGATYDSDVTANMSGLQVGQFWKFKSGTNSPYTAKIELKTTGVTNGSYPVQQQNATIIVSGDKFSVPTFTVDTKGRLTAAGSQTYEFSNSVPYVVVTSQDVTNDTYNPVQGKYYSFSYTISSLTINLPRVGNLQGNSVQNVILYFTTSQSSNVSVSINKDPNDTNVSVRYQTGYVIDVNMTYEVNCLFNGIDWVIVCAEIG